MGVRTSRTRATGAAVPAALLGLVLSACGGADEAPTAPRETDASATSSGVTTDLPPLERAEEPWQVARQITTTESVVRDERSTYADRAAAGRLQQLAYRTLAERPRWDARVAELVGDRYAGALRDNVAARREMLAMQRAYEPHDTLPAWRIVRPEPAADLRSHYAEAEDRFGVGWEYLAAINLIETGMGRIVGDSVAGAKGPMQFIDPTWEQYGRGDVRDSRDAILAAGRYLSARGFTEGDDAAIDDAIYAYNNHPAYVRAIRHHAAVMERDPRAFLGYYHWDVVFLTREGDVTLPVGYDADEPIPVRRWLRDHPQP